jgi:hypothetical protein
LRYGQSVAQREIDLAQIFVGRGRDGCRYVSNLSDAIDRFTGPSGDTDDAMPIRDQTARHVDILPWKVLMNEKKIHALQSRGVVAPPGVDVPATAVGAPQRQPAEGRFPSLSDDGPLRRGGISSTRLEVPATTDEGRLEQQSTCVSRDDHPVRPRRKMYFAMPGPIAIGASGRSATHSRGDQ